MENVVFRIGCLRYQLYKKNQDEVSVVNFFKPAIFNNLVASLTAVAFTTAVINLPQLQAVGVNLEPAAINFGIKVEKIVEKIEKAIDKGETNKIVGYMFDIKSEVEQYTGNKIDINKQLDQAQKEARARGQKIDDRYIKQIKKDFGKKDKKHKHRAVWFAKCTELDIPYSTLEADLHFDLNYMEKSSKGGDKDIDVPIPILVGVTISLCGLFLCFVPIPICQTSGFWLINTGVGILGGEAIQKWDAYDREKK